MSFQVVYVTQNAGCHLFLRQKPDHRLPEILRWYACGVDGPVVGVLSRKCQILSDG